MWKRAFYCVEKVWILSAKGEAVGLFDRFNDVIRQEKEWLKEATQKGYLIKFDSKDEAEIYLCLRELQEQGLIEDLEKQVPFELVPKHDKEGVHYRDMKYLADFSFELPKDDLILCLYPSQVEYFKSLGNPAGSHIIPKTTDFKVVIDVKGWRTEVYKLKKKIFEYKYSNLTIMEVEV